jgi:hypothetical protein
MELGLLAWHTSAHEIIGVHVTNKIQVVVMITKLFNALGKE